MAVSNDKIYDLINSVRLELKEDIHQSALAAARNIGQLEGRVNALEKIAKDLQIKDSTLNLKMGVIVFIAVTVAESIIGALIYNFLKVHK